MKTLKKPCTECYYKDLPEIPYEQLDERSKDLEEMSLEEIAACEIGFCHKSNGKNICWGLSERKRLQEKNYATHNTAQ